MNVRTSTAILMAALASAVALTLPTSGTASATGALPSAEPTPVTHDVEGAMPLPTDRTVAHWAGAFSDPSNGLTYGFNMVGGDPALRHDTTIPVDVLPLNFDFTTEGVTLKGSDVIPNLLASPIFRANDYSTVPAVTGHVDATGRTPVLTGGPMSAANTRVQFLDAYMRAQFDAVGSTYHVRLAPTVLPAQTIKVPQGMGQVFRSPRGVVWAEQNVGSAYTAGLPQHLDPTHLLLLVTNNVFVGHPGQWCCALGFHTASRSQGASSGGTSNQGNGEVPTWAYAAYLQPGTINPAVAPADTDVTVFDHELAEWADDPFASNQVNPWYSPLPPQNGCGSLLETGDPVDRIGFMLPGNNFDSGPYADGYWHLQDDTFLPWYARQAPNTTSQPSQTATAAIGRYSFMGDLNPYPDFHQPARGC